MKTLEPVNICFIYGGQESSEKPSPSSSCGCLTSIENKSDLELAITAEQEIDPVRIRRK
jgi:hypothetical protein